MTEENQGLSTCPHCGRQAPPADECGHCGIVFAKYRRRESEAAHPMTYHHSMPAESRRSGGRSLGGLLVLLLTAWLGTLAVSHLLDRKSETELTAVAAAARESVAPAKTPRATPKGESAPSATPSPPLTPTEATLQRMPGSPPSAASPRPASRPVRSVPSSHRWYEGADGFLEGFEEAERENQAVLVYFYTDWCPYCKKLDRDILSRAQVEATTKYFVKIKVNPEDGNAEKLLKARYGVQGVPSLFVHPAGSDRPTKIRTMTKRNGRWQASSPADFTALLTRTAGESFGAG